MTSTHELLIQQGYKLIDDAWSLNGSLTYDHNDDATHEFIASLAKVSGAPVGRSILDDVAKSISVDRNGRTSSIINDFIPPYPF